MAAWYIVENGQQVGPLTDELLTELLERGRVTGETWVWNETLPEWRRYEDVRAARRKAEARHAAPGAGDHGEILTAPGPEPEAEPGQAAAADEVACAECGHFFPSDELVPIRGRWICAGCKALTLQKVREGLGCATGMQYAGFWIRAVASIIDGLALFAMNMVISLVIHGLILWVLPAFFPQGARGVAGVAGASLGWLIQMAAAAAYTTVFLGRYGATPGKAACGIKVVRSAGSPLSYRRACGRHFAEMLSGFTLFIGYLIVVFDDERRALHDHICDTRVVYRMR